MKKRGEKAVVPATRASINLCARVRVHVHQSALTTGSGGGRSRLGFDTANRTLAFCGTSPGRANQRRSHEAHADTHIARTRVQTNTDTTYFVFWAADVILNTKHRWKLATCVFDLSRSVLTCQCLSFLLTCSPSSSAFLSFVSLSLASFLLLARPV